MTVLTVQGSHPFIALYFTGNISLVFMMHIYCENVFEILITCIGGILNIIMLHQIAMPLNKVRFST